MPELQALLETCGTVPADEQAGGSAPVGGPEEIATDAAAQYRRWATASARAMTALAQTHQAEGAKGGVLAVSARVLTEQRERLERLQVPAR